MYMYMYIFVSFLCSVSIFNDACKLISQEVVKLVKPEIVNNGQALHLRARQKLQDRDGK